MQLSSKILRGAEIKGWRTYYPPLRENSICSEGAAAFSSPEERITGATVGAGAAGACAGVAPPPLPTREEMEKERRQILELARQESESLRQQILAEGKEEAARMQEKAWQDGFAQGRLEGEKAAEEVKSEAKALLEDAYRQKDEILTGAEPEIIRLAVNLAEKLLNYQLSVDDDLIIALISRCLESLPGGDEVVLRVSPYDEAACRERVEFISSMLKKGADLEIVADGDIAPGCCKVESEESEVTFLLNRELQILAGKLLELAGTGGEVVIDDGMAEEMYVDEYMADEGMMAEGMMDEGAVDEEFVSDDEALGADESEWDEAAGAEDGVWDEAAEDEGMWDEAVEDESAAYTA